MSRTQPTCPDCGNPRPTTRDAVAGILASPAALVTIALMALLLTAVLAGWLGV